MFLVQLFINNTQCNLKVWLKQHPNSRRLSDQARASANLQARNIIIMV